MNRGSSSLLCPPVARPVRAVRRAFLLAWLASGLATAVSGPAIPSVASNDLIHLEVRDVQGRVVRPWAKGGDQPVLLFFLMHDCPAANGYAPEINRIVADYPQVRSHVVYPEATLKPAAARDHVREYGFRCVALLDPAHRLVRAAGATLSPEAALVSARGEVLYLGRIDDRMAALGKRRPQPTRRDLRLALDAVLAGRPVPEPRTRAIGCYLPDPGPVSPGVVPEPKPSLP